MIAVAAVVAILQAAPVPSVVTVRDGEVVASVAVHATGRGPMVRPEEGLVPLGAVLVRQGSGGYRLVVRGVEIVLTTGAAVAHVGGLPQPLPGPPVVLEGRLLVPVAVLTDLIPRVVEGFLYDPSTWELRRTGPARGAPASRGDLVAGAAQPATPSAPSPSPARATPRLRPSGRHVVVVDAGHGGPDRGMSGPRGARRRIQEADITLQVATRLRRTLEARGVDVLMTRTTDTLIALADRGRIANDAQADLFISIHVNAANPRWRNPGAARGVETYFLSAARTEDERRVEEIENEVVRFESGQDLSEENPLNFILKDMKQNEYLRESSNLAAVIQQGLARVHPGSDRGVKQAGFSVLVTAFMPAVLVEVGFGTNAAEAGWLSGAAGQEAIAASVAASVAEYLRSLDRRTGTGEAPR